MRRAFRTLLILVVVMAALGTGFTSAHAHQPYCEFVDVTKSSPWQVPDATISYAYYGNLYPEADVDYFTFEAMADQSVLLSLSIPAIEGQKNFAPMMAVYGPGLDMDLPADLDERVEIPEGAGGMIVPLGDEAEYWFEPFGGRYYWNWDNYFLDVPEDATYTVALWHPEQELGRYSFVVGEQEVFGGEQECFAAFDSYWTPLVAGENPYRDQATVDSVHVHTDGETHDHGAMLEIDGPWAPIVDLQVVPLDDGGYNIRVQTMNFRFAPEHVGMEPVDGEGHAHLYVDGEKVARIYGEWYHLESLPQEAEQVSVALYANNHQVLVLDGAEVADTVDVASFTY